MLLQGGFGLNDKALHFSILAACLVFIGAAPAQPTLGACGTAYAFVLLMVSDQVATMLGIKRFFVDIRNGAWAVMFVLNFLVAGLPLIYVFSIRARFTERQYLALLGLWTVAYAALYFVLLPSQDCP